MYRPVAATVWLIVAAAVAVLLLGDALLRSGWRETALLAPWVLLLLWGVYVVLFASAVVTDADGIEVRNLLRVTRASWGQVADITMAYQIVVRLLDGRRVNCFGGPVRGRPRRSAHGGRLPALRPRDEDEAPVVDTTGVDQADRIVEEWERAGAVSGTGTIARSWDLPALVALAVLVVWAVAAVLIAYAR
ncbi:PH domain-containing protein [Microbacterium sp. SORGH_AS_0888]|uniref:PH domain-containing protein n=1 Tax=Microbacterium sp. SORGH_AS_0888 TaxID=3041791 RepID=UPI0027887368|nr:PH domain-containing protein [Microbacterium sp. SORGH_AS_0888]MDQ1128173.1 hypothetical protein [Microbacterium sp. SORGH_AS_0888]